MFVALFLCFLAIGEIGSKQTRELAVGGIFQDDVEETAFHTAVAVVNSKYSHSPLKLFPETLRISHHNTFNVSSSTCSLLQKGVVSVFGPNSIHSSPYVQVLLDRKEIPHIETHWDRHLERHNCLLNLHPHPSKLTEVFTDLILKWRWKKMVILYEDAEALARISPLLDLRATHGLHIVAKHLQVEGLDNYRPALIAVKKGGDTNFILDCSIDILEEVLRQAQQVGMMTDKYNYIITNLDVQTINLKPFQFSGTNITMMRMVSPSYDEFSTVFEGVERKFHSSKGESNISSLKLKIALMVDGVELLYHTLSDLAGSQDLIIKSKSLFCNKTDNWKSGHTIVNYMKRKSLYGLTGLVKFDAEGFRRDFTLEVLELTPDGLYEIGTWNSKTKLIINRKTTVPPNSSEEGSLVNKTFIVRTCLTTPYGMLKETTSQLTGNDRFEGFGIDLIDELSKMLGFNYTITIQEDGQNGNYDPEIHQWTGLIGAIIRNETDLAIADLTVTAERESVVDFTLQFMNLGITILYKKPKPVPPSLFMFTSPFSDNVWYLLGGTYFVVSFCFFIMGRLSPSEWTNPYPCVQEPKYLTNQFSIKNSLWFTVGSLLQQGTEIAPASISTRTAAGVWWFFSLIMVSSYTANLAAFLTVETLVTPFSNVKELAEQTEIKYGAKRGGATANFFKNSEDDPVRNTIWKYMYHHDEVMTDTNDEGVERVEQENYAFFMESTTIEYVVERHCSLASVGSPLDDKGYAIAMKKNSSYRNDLSAAILKLQETGRIAALKEKWWKEKRRASACDAGDEGNVATPLNLQNVGGVFLVLFTGTILGFFCSFAELACKVYSKTRNDRTFKHTFVEEMKFFIRFKHNTKIMSTEGTN